MDYIDRLIITVVIAISGLLLTSYFLTGEALYFRSTLVLWMGYFVGFTVGRQKRPKR